MDRRGVSSNPQHEPDAEAIDAMWLMSFQQPDKRGECASRAGCADLHATITLELGRKRPSAV